MLQVVLAFSDNCKLSFLICEGVIKHTRRWLTSSWSMRHNFVTTGNQAKKIRTICTKCTKMHQNAPKCTKMPWSASFLEGCPGMFWTKLQPLQVCWLLMLKLWPPSINEYKTCLKYRDAQQWYVCLFVPSILWSLSNSGTEILNILGKVLHRTAVQTEMI